MKPRFPLLAKILLLVLGNLVLLAGMLALFAGLRAQQGLDSFLLGTARERIRALASSIALELDGTDEDARDAMLARYAAAYKVDLYLFDNDGPQAAGPKVNLPAEVHEHMTRGPGDGPRLGSEEPAPPPPPPTSDGEPRKKKAKKGKGKGKQPDPLSVPPFLVVAEDGRYWVGVRLPIGVKDRDSLPVRGTLFIVTGSFLTNPFYVNWPPFLAVSGVAILVTLLFWVPMVRGLTHSIAGMMRATAGIARGDFGVAVDAGRSDELGSLGASIREMAAQLEDHMHGQKRFLRDAAHELRSPIARMQVALGILEREAPAEMQTRLNDLKEEVDAMSELTRQLLTYARSDHGHEKEERRAVAVREIAERAARKEGVEAEIQVDPGLRAIAAPDALFRCLSNLLRNSQRYAGGAGPIVVSAQARDGEVDVVVSDAGPGIPESAMSRLFTPFFRVQDARDRQSGGTGLGMSIAKACAEACGGSIECANRKPKGLAVTVRLRVP